MEQTIRLHMKALGLPPDAVEWLVMLWGCIQVFDDVADGDPIKRGDLDTVIMNSLVLMPGNPFFRANSSHLIPVLMTAILKWKASDTVEKSGKADARSYMWRASYYDVVLMVVALCHGPQAAMDASDSVMLLYGETFAGYLKEFDYA